MRRTALVVTAVLFGCLALVGSAAAQCDSDFVTVSAKFITVAPTGADDTANLQCALDLGAATGPGVTVWLAEGTFHTEQLVIKDFRGRISGMGQGVTILHSPSYALHIDRPCIGTGPCFADEPPSATNRYPSLVSILGTDVTVTDLSIVVSGGYGTERWEFWGGKMNLLSNVVQVMGSNGWYRLDGIAIDAGAIRVAGGINVGDAAGGINMWSFSRPWSVTDSTLTLSRSYLRGGSSGFMGYNLDRSRVFVRDNRFELNGARVGFSDVLASQVMVEGNEIAGLTPGAIGGNGIRLNRGNLLTGIVDSSLWFANNTILANRGIFIEAGTFDNVKCQAVNNDMGATTTPFFLNGQPCKVVADQ